MLTVTLALLAFTAVLAVLAIYVPPVAALLHALAAIGRISVAFVISLAQMLSIRR
ncbi:hypothetical protein [Paenarthrobacter nicotinovorans]|uniref:hypothetical protein n=1 Tax=Paenarthrobacter nicotinovorans TaxID=29320 RepID=UPI003D67793C